MNRAVTNMVSYLKSTHRGSVKGMTKACNQTIKIVRNSRNYRQRIQAESLSFWLTVKYAVTPRGNPRSTTEK